MEQDSTEAVRWYRIAAEQGHAIAQNNLGMCYSYGNGVTQDYTKAVRWFRLAAEQGDADAQELVNELQQTQHTDSSSKL